MAILSKSVVGNDAKPTPLNVNPTGIPSYLRERQQWVCWKYEHVTDKAGNPKWTKVPYHPKNFKAASNNPSTWSHFAEVLSAQAANKFDGIGFMLGEDDGLSAIDLDHCIDPVTGEWSKPEAREIVERFKGKAYVERSPGGDGIRLFVLGKSPRSGKGKQSLGLNWIEAYTHPSSRYLTVTGNVLANWSVNELLEAQEELDWLNDQYLQQAPVAPSPALQMPEPWELGEIPLWIRERWVDGANDPILNCAELVDEMERHEDDALIARIESSKQGPKFSALFHHGMVFDEKSGGMLEGLDASSMDASLVGILGFWCRNNTTQVHRIMCRSTLAEREKWASPRGESTYGWMTVEKIIGERIASGADVWGGDDTPVGGEPEEGPKDQAQIGFPGPFPGFMAEMVQETLAVAPKPQPELTLISVLIGMSSACDGHVRLPDGGRLNLYGLGCVESAEGKDLPRRVSEDIGHSCGAKLIGSPGSGQGLEDALVEGQGMLCAIDEVGHFLQALHAEKAPAHAIEVSKNLLRLYSASNGTFITRERAALKGQRQSRVIHNPTLSVIGFTTPGELSKGLSSASIDSGLLGRFLFAPGKQDVKQRFVMQKLSMDPMWFEAIKQHNIDRGTEERIIEIPEAAETAILNLNDRLHEEQVASGSPEQRALLKRTLEKILRVAGVLAFWSDHRNPIMGLDHLAWAERFVRASNWALLEFCSERLHDGAIQSNAAKVIRIVADYLSGKRTGFQNHRQQVLLKENRLVARALVLRESHLSAPEFNLAVAHGVQAGGLDEGNTREEDTRKQIAWLALPS
jgi:hypothetical protein